MEGAADESSRPRLPALLARGWLPALVACWAAGWVYLGTETLRIGPHRFDDFRYAYDAIAGVFDPGIRFRYVHVWSLRAFYGLVTDRITAAATYAAVVHAGLVLTAAALAHRAAGRAGALFAALLIPFYPPLLQFISTPLPDPPSTLWAGLALLCALPGPGGRHALGRALLAGLLCFASVRCKETGVAVVPVVAALLCRQPGLAPLRALSLAAAGAVVGQLGLSLVDWAVTGDPLVGLRPEVFSPYAEAIGGAPTRPVERRSLMRHGWLELLLERGMRSYLLLALLGFAFGLRRSLTLSALAMWGLLTLVFSGWVSYRYAGIDAHVRYLGPLSLPLSVGAAWLLARLWHAGAALAGVPWWPAGEGGACDADDAPASAPDEADGAHHALRQRASRVLLACGLLGVLWVLQAGLRGGVAEALGGRQDFGAQRAAYFLLPLSVLLCLWVAAIASGPWLRRASVVAILSAVMLLGWTPARAYHQRVSLRIYGWQALGKKLDRMDVDTLVRYRIGDTVVLPSLLRWRALTLSQRDPARLTVRDVAGVQDLRPGEIVLTDMRSEKKRKQLAAAGYRARLVLLRSRARIGVFVPDDRRPPGEPPAVPRDAEPDLPDAGVGDDDDVEGTAPVGDIDTAVDEI